MSNYRKLAIFIPLVLLVSLGLLTEAEPCKNNPSLVASESGKTSLLLPKSVREMFGKNFPSVTVPDQSKMTGLWATETKPGSLPYFAKGDFDGDGLEDFALLLNNEKEYWVLILKGTADCEYSVAYKGGRSFGEGISLQNVFLRTIPRGEEERAESIGPGGKPVESTVYKFNTDAIEWTVVEGSVSLVYWKNGKYESVYFGNE